VTDGKDQPDGDEETPATKSGSPPWWVIVGVMASAVTVLGFFGIANFAQLRHFLPGPQPPTTTPTYVPAPEVVGLRTAPDIETTTITAETTTYQLVVPTTPPFDPATLDGISTDRTLFVQAALLPSTFTDGRGIRYSLVASSAIGCDRPYGMTDNIRTTLDAYGCSSAMTGDYLVNSPTISYDSDVFVSVQVFPLDTASAVTQARAGFAGVPADFGIWCPSTGSLGNLCGSRYASAHKHQYVRSDHRYLVEATAMYLNQTPDSSVESWIGPAALTADTVSGPDDH
jgi:hypothetical protein